MPKPPALRELPELPEEIVQAGLNGELILFVGAGLSMLLNLPSWRGLASKALEYLQGRGWLDYSEMEQLQALSPRTQLSIAKLIADENGDPLDLRGYFKSALEESTIYKALNDIGCTCVTTNYDELLAPRFLEAKDGSTTPKPVTRVFDREQFFAKHLDDTGVVVHIHGSVSKPDGMIVTTKEYLEHYDHKNLQHFLGELFRKKTVLFLGYGLEENELLEHILRRGSVGATAGQKKRFALQGFFRSQEPLYQKLYEYYRASFGVYLVGFIRDHKNYQQQDAIVKSWASRIKINKPALAGDLARINEVLGNG